MINDHSPQPEILPRRPDPAPDRAAASLVRRIACNHRTSAALQALIEGLLRHAVTAAAEYGNRREGRAHPLGSLRDWAEFSEWCWQNGADPADLPVNPVLVAA